MRHSSLARLLAIIAVIALSIAAIRDSSGPWAEIVVGVTGGAFVVAIVLFSLRRGKSAGWGAFALAGGAYFLASWPIATSPRQIPFTSNLVEYVALKMDEVGNPPPQIRHPPSTRAAFFKLNASARLKYSIESNIDSEKDRAWENGRIVRLDSSRRIGHSCLSLAIGAVFAAIASMIRSRQATDVEPSQRVAPCL